MAQTFSTMFSGHMEQLRGEEYDSLISWIVEKCGQSDASRNDRKAMLIILSGWKIRKKSKVECEQCFRALGLWNYSSDVDPEPKRLSSEEWDKQKEEFIKEYSRVGTTEEYPAQDAERYEKEDDRIEKPNGSLKKNPRVELKVPEGSEKDIVSRVGTIEEYPVPDTEWYGKEEDQVLKSNGSIKETPRVELEVPEGSNEDDVNIVGTAKEYPAQDGERYGEEDEQVQKSDGSMKETSKVELEVSEESEKDDVRRIGTARACPAEDAERYEKEENQVEKLNASLKETTRVEMEAPDNDNASAQAAESQRPQNIDKPLDVNLLEEKPKLQSQTRKDSDSPMNKKKKMEEKPTLDPLAEHFPWCRWVFVGFGNVTEDVSPSWLQRIEVLTPLMIQDKIRRKSKSHSLEQAFIGYVLMKPIKRLVAS
ncbi:uncharacterized protein LOC136031562 [Artemia franciscana]|uniref:uncharacterized protein LOC136031562 n=1 Tax=Artemia franciscana TaxID=6661 RepID=UPI0032D9EDCC